MTAIRMAALIVAVLFASITATPAIAAERMALLIGNSEYLGEEGDAEWLRLPNPANDVALVARSLREVGFEVTVVSNGTWEEMRAATSKFSSSIDGAEVVLFYFAGHGFEYGRRNYLVPVDAPLESSSEDLRKSFIEFEALAASLTYDGTTIFMLDACRTNGDVTPRAQADGAITRSAPAPVITGPTTRQSASAGVREYDFEPGASVAVLYSTGRGVPAYDAAPPPEDISPFALEVAQRVKVPKVDVSLIFNAIRQGVYERTEGYWPPQVPFTYNSLMPNTFLSVGTAEIAAPDDAQAAAPVAPESGPETAPESFPEPAQAPTQTPTPAQPALRPINLSLEELERIDEPILIVRVLSEHSVADIEALVAAGDPLATYLLGYMQHFGMGVAKDLGKARATLERAAAQGTPYGQLELAYFLRVNAEDQSDTQRARGLYKAAADQGYAKARAHYARVLIGEAESPQSPDYAEGVEQLRLAAADEYAYAFYGLAYAVPDEREEQIGQLRALAAQGRSDADQQLCSILVRERREAEAVPYCEIAANAGYPDAFANLALAANEGWVSDRSIDDARFWMRQALSRGDLGAGLCAQMVSLQYELAVETNTLSAARILNCSRSQ